MNTNTVPAQEVTATASRVFASDKSVFQQNFNKNPFQFSHNLHGNPLFELPRLQTLANRILDEHRETKGVLWQNHNAPVDAKWSDVPKKMQMDKLGEAIANLDKSGSWVLLYSVQSDPEYNEVLNQIINEVEDMVGAFKKDISIQDAYIFLASPQSVTPYHIDHETTFLFQIHGNRTANIWDRSIVPENELENYYMGYLSAAKYKEENLAKAHTYALNAGTGVHHPSCAPHAFKNGNSYSVALGVHFCLNPLDVTSRIYQVNGLLRRVGMKPTPPGKSQWRDNAKIRSLGVFSKRNPKTKMEILRSGMMRISAPAIWANNIKKKIKAKKESGQ